MQAKYIGPSHNLHFADCLNFSYKFRTLGSGNSCDSRTQPEMSANEDEATGEVETGIIESNQENSIRFSLYVVDERIKASLEPLHAQITALTEMVDHMIQSNSAKETTTTRHQYESPYSEVPGSSRFPTVAPLATAGYSPDRGIPQIIAPTRRWRVSYKLSPADIEIFESNSN